MAELVGLVGTAIGLAEFGFKLSVKLLTFSQAVSSAAADARDMSNEVSLTSTVLRELVSIIEADRGAVVSPAALEATRRTVDECLGVFRQIDAVLSESLGIMGGGAKGAAALERLKWPWKQKNLELLRCNLDRLKASLTLMLQVLSYGRDISNRQTAEASLAYQQHVIGNMAQFEKDMNGRYTALQQALEDQGLGITGTSSGGFGSRPPSYDDASHGGGGVMNASAVDGSQNARDPDQAASSPAPPTPPLPPYAEDIQERSLIGELLVCFQLLDGLLIRRRDSRPKPALPYREFIDILDEIQRGETRHLQASMGGRAYDRLEAVRRLHVRLLELAGSRGSEWLLQPKKKKQETAAEKWTASKSYRAAAPPVYHAPHSPAQAPPHAQPMSEVITIEAPEPRTYSHIEPIQLVEPVQAPPTSTYSEDLAAALPVGGEGEVTDEDLGSGKATEMTFGGEGAAQHEKDDGEEGEDEQSDETIVNELLSRWTTVRLDATSDT